MARPATGQVIVRRGKRGCVFGLRFRAYGRRHYITTNAATREVANLELANVLADVRRGIWQPPRPRATIEPPEQVPTFLDVRGGVVRASRTRGARAKPRALGYGRLTATSCGSGGTSSTRSTLSSSTRTRPRNSRADSQRRASTRR